MLEESDHGRAYSARDPGGYLWSFGDYRPDKPQGCYIAPVLFYDNVREAIAFLEQAFGFEPGMLVEEADGSVVHSEMRLGLGVVMPVDKSYSAEDDNPWSRVPFGLSVYIADPDAHHARALAAGVEVVRPLRDEEYGACGYSVKDIEGNLWNFGNHRPEGSRA
jgi:uncharacterized glyoxalase superfamily protein PhnB